MCGIVKGVPQWGQIKLKKKIAKLIKISFDLFNWYETALKLRPIHFQFSSPFYAILKYLNCIKTY